HNATQLWREIKSKGYPGGVVAQFVSKLRVKRTKYFGGSGNRRATKLLSPKAVAMLLTKPQQELDPSDHAALPPVLRHCPELVELQQLGHDFKQAFQLQSAEALSAWMERHRAQHSVPFIDLQPDCVAIRRRLQPPCHSP